MDQKLRFLARGVLPVIYAVCNGFDYAPGESDLDDEQPIVVHMTLGEYRKALRLKPEIEKSV